MRVDLNTLESDRFGVRFGRLGRVPDDGEGLAAILADADGRNVDVISVRTDATDLAAVHRLEAAGFRLMDTLVYHRFALSSDRQVAAPDDRVVELSAAHAPACAALARRAFGGYLGHYHADPRLNSAAADEAYADWITRLLNQSQESQISVGTQVEGVPVGFLVGVPRGATSSEILLNAVEPALQGSGLYGAMLRHYLTAAQARGDKEVLISTQLQNFVVQRAWARAGSTLIAAYYTLHRWRQDKQHQKQPGRNTITKL